MGVEEAVIEEDEVSGNDLVPADLVHLTLFQQLPPRLDQLKVANPTLQPEHLLELFSQFQLTVGFLRCFRDNFQRLVGRLKVWRRLVLVLDVVIEQEAVLGKSLYRLQHVHAQLQVSALWQVLKFFHSFSKVGIVFAAVFKHL